MKYSSQRCSEIVSNLRHSVRRLLGELFPPVRKLEAKIAKARQQISLLENENTALKAKVWSFAPTGAVFTSSQQLWTSEHIGSSPLLFTPPTLTGDLQGIVDRFHTFMYDVADQTSCRTYFVSWLGYGMFKWPTDLWNYQEIIVETRPDVIIETGTHRGGSALFLATICDLLGHGQVITIDIDETFGAMFPRHPRITYITGSSTDHAVVDQITAIVDGRANVLVILDSDHQRDHVLRELRIYSSFIPAGGHLIVEDTNVNGHPALREFGPGPWEAVERFVAENSDFYVDRTQERFYLTHNPSGFLRRRP
jgi:cephalosporin hydroxylase